MVKLITEDIKLTCNNIANVVNTCAYCDWFIVECKPIRIALYKDTQCHMKHFTDSILNTTWQRAGAFVAVHIVVFPVYFIIMLCRCI